MATVVRPRPIRVGCAAGAQSVYTGRGGDVRGERNAAGDRLRVRPGRRAAAAGDAGLRTVREKPCRVSAGEATALRSGGGGGSFSSPANSAAGNWAADRPFCG